jgi:hypothetical protein
VQQTFLFPDEDHPVLYRLAVFPNKEVADEITALKQQVAYHVGKYPGQHTPPDITVARFEMLPSQEDVLVRYLDEFCFKNLNSANVELTGFHPHEGIGGIIVAPRQAAYFTNMNRKVARLLKTVPYCRPEAARYTPFMPVAEGLTAERFRLACDMLAQKIYAGVFYANNLVLLRKTPRPDTYRIIRTFALL